MRVTGSAGQNATDLTTIKAVELVLRLRALASPTTALFLWGDSSTNCLGP